MEQPLSVPQDKQTQAECSDYQAKTLPGVHLYLKLHAMLKNKNFLFRKKHFVQAQIEITQYDNVSQYK
jgi:hypothetical protein